MNKDNQNNQIDSQRAHDQIHKLFTSAKEISLTHEEKTQGAQSFQNFMENNPDGEVSILSPYFKNLFVSTFNFVKQRQLVAVALALVLIIGAGSTAAFAARYSLPGDLLYPIKINVYEKLESALAVGPEAKARIAVKHSVTRIEEVEKLAAQGNIDQTDEQTVNENFAIQTKEVADNILKLKTDGNIQAAIKVSADFENVLTDHKKNLDSIAESNKGILAETRSDIDNNILASAKTRLVLEGNLSTSSPLLMAKIKRHENNFDKKHDYEYGYNNGKATTAATVAATATITTASTTSVATSIVVSSSTENTATTSVNVQSPTPNTPTQPENTPPSAPSPVIPFTIPSLPSIPATVHGLLH